MIEERARIIITDGDYAWVETDRSGACGGCASREGCGTASLSKQTVTRKARLRALNQVGAGVGDQVVIGIENSGLLRGSALVYLLPLLAMFLFAVGGRALFGPEEIAVTLSALAGLAAGFGVVARASRNVGSNPRYQAVILRREALSRPIKFIPS